MCYRPDRPTVMPGKIVDGSTRGLLTYSMRAPEGYREGDGKKWPAVVILLAMLASKGTSVLRSVYVINRGYEDLATRLNLLGAKIETFRDI